MISHHPKIVSKPNLFGPLSTKPQLAQRKQMFQSRHRKKFCNKECSGDRTLPLASTGSGSNGAVHKAGPWFPGCQRSYVAWARQFATTLALIVFSFLSVQHYIYCSSPGCLSTLAPPAEQHYPRSSQKPKAPSGKQILRGGSLSMCSVGQPIISWFTLASSASFESSGHSVQ